MYADPLTHINVYTHTHTDTRTHTHTHTLDLDTLSPPQDTLAGAPLNPTMCSYILGLKPLFISAPQQPTASRADSLTAPANHKTQQPTPSPLHPKPHLQSSIVWEGSTIRAATSVVGELYAGILGYQAFQGLPHFVASDVQVSSHQIFILSMIRFSFRGPDSLCGLGRASE